MTEPIRVLIVEDSPTQAAALAATLESAGYAVTVAQDGDAGIAAFEANGFDMVVSDVIMPGAMSGFDLCSRIKQGPRKETPVILLTGLSDPLDIVRGLECGADNFFTKPCDPDYFLRRLRTLLDTREFRSRERLRMGVRVFFMGREFTITSQREQIIDLLMSTFEDAVLQNHRLREREVELEAAKTDLARYAGTLEQRLQSVLESVPDVLFSVSPDWQTVYYVSPTSIRVFGLAPDAMSFEAWQSRLHPGDREAVLGAMQVAADTPAQQSMEYRYRHDDGTVRWIAQEIVSIAGPDGSVERLHGTARDITPRKAAEAALAQSEARFLSFVERAPNGIYRATTHGRLLDVNPALVTMLRYESAAALLAVNLISDVYADPAEFVRMMARFEQGANGDGDETLWKRKDGTTFTVRQRGTAVRDEAGRVVAHEAIVEDVTERRSLEEQLRQAQKMEAVGRLAGGVAHDFNNLLTVILGEADLMQPEGSDTAALRNSRDEIRKAAESASVLTRQLLTFSRRQLVEPKVLNVNDLVRDLESMLRRLIGEDVTLVMRPAPDAGTVRADRGQLEQVLVNLAVNARDAMPRGGHLTIEVLKTTLQADYVEKHVDARPGEYVVLVVSDTGAGMTKEVQEHLFEPFFTTKELGRGTGLGLATCYGIVKGIGGHIGVYSEVGIGTTLKVYLPRVATPADDAPRKVSQSLARGTETILLLEDEAGVRSIAARILTKLGYQVLESGDGAEALQLLQQHEAPVHLLLTDVVLPGMGGREVAEQAQQLRPSLRVLFASGYTIDVMLQHRLMEHRVALLHKPFTPESLAKKVREVLDG